jgi:enoyl-CoA hydratase/carnithine racemase
MPIDIPKVEEATLTLEEGVALFVMNRDDVRNALTGTQLAVDIVRCAQWIHTCEAVRVWVITGAGAAFSAGGNIKDMALRMGDFGGSPAQVAQQYRQGIQQIPLALDAVEVPILAAVNGAAVGAGFDLANMADIRIASEKARFGETFLNLGIIPGDGGAWFLQRQIGYQRAFELTMTGRLIDAQEALRLGIVLEVHSHADFLAQTMALAQKMAAQPPKALRLTKRLMKSAQRQNLKDFLDLCACFQGFCHNEPEHAVAVQAMMASLRR